MAEVDLNQNCPAVAVIDYTNWRGKRQMRIIIPHFGTLRIGVSRFHPKPGFMFDATDLAARDNPDEPDKSFRTFSMDGIHSWRVATNKEVFAALNEGKNPDEETSAGVPGIQV